MQENNSVPMANSPQTTEVQPVLSAKDNQPKTNNFLAILLSVLLFISVSIAGFFAFQTQKLVKELTALKAGEKVVALATNEPTIEPVATESSETDPTANWKTYTNNTYGFLIKYPTSWTELTTEEEKLRGNPGYTNLFTILKTDKNEFVSVTVFDGPAKSSQNTQSYKTFDLKNNKSVSISYTDNLGPGTKPGAVDVLVFSNILSTFKLIN